MMTFLFWNTKGNPVQRIIGDIVEMYKVDIIILSECKIDEVSLIEELSRHCHFVRSPTFARTNAKISIYAKSNKDWLQPLMDTAYLSIRHLVKPTGHREILIVAAHLPSKRFHND